jgi:translin
MQNLEAIVEKIRATFDARTKARDQALAQARLLTRHCAHAIRAIHRSEHDLAQENLGEARRLATTLRHDLKKYPDLYFAGYTQDALKEYAEANITCALIENQPLPSPEELGLEDATYLNGLAEVTGELRRRVLDLLRQGYSEETERLLNLMDDIYEVLVTLDYPDAITNGLRRQTDLARGIVERTRGDMTISIREQHLQQALAHLEARLEPAKKHADDPGV